MSRFKKTTGRSGNTISAHPDQLKYPSKELKKDIILTAAALREIISMKGKRSGSLFKFSAALSDLNNLTIEDRAKVRNEFKQADKSELEKLLADKGFQSRKTR